MKLGESDVPRFGFTWSNAPAGDHMLMASSSFYSGQSTNSNTVAAHLAIVPPPTLSITNLGNGSLAIRGQGMAGLSYRFQFTADLVNPLWQSTAPITANGSGSFALTNSVNPAPRFYRAIYP